jgi:AcrR family transcriptional regulator
MPRSVELAWRGSAERKPGRRPSLSLEQIVEAAMRIADTAGIASVSLARIATDLGCATTALYRHVRSKDDLVILMRDAAAAPPPDLPRPDAQHWKASLDNLAWHIFALYKKHPWVLEVPSIGPPTTPNELAWGEHMLRAMSGTNLDSSAKLRAITLLSGYVREQARLSADPVVAKGDEFDYLGLLQRVMTPERFPMFCQVLTDETVDNSIAYTDEDFQFGLDRILAGLAELEGESDRIRRNQR